MQTSVQVLIGAGGVGKTTCSIGVGIAAARKGKRVAVLSIDPAKRLAAALGIPLTGEFTRIDVGGEKSGTLDAAILDQKAVFDHMVRRFAPNVETFQKILDNRLYQAISARLSGSLEYMALARLQELVEAELYEVIVLDTPPDTQALDFLNRPNILENFMENKVMSWLIKPFYVASKLGAGRLVSLGEKLMGGIAKVTGVQSLQIVAEFLVLMQQVVAGFHRAGGAIRETLQGENTRFLLVTRLQEASLRSARTFARELYRLGYEIDQVVFNRALPRNIAEAVANLSKEAANEPVIATIIRRCAEENRLEREIKKDLLATFAKQSIRSVKIDESSPPSTLSSLVNFSLQFS